MSNLVCCGEVVINHAGGKDFYYCRGCKKEVLEVQDYIDDPYLCSCGGYYQLKTDSDTFNGYYYCENCQSEP